MKRSGFKNKARKPLRRTRLRVAGHSSASDDKREIQRLLREIVLLRDGKCILWGIRCGHEVGMEGMVWQAEHLIERSNSATYGDSRLVVLVERSCHGWKHFTKSNHDQYDEWARSRIPKDRVDLWDRCRKDSWRPKPGSDWKLTIAALKQELGHLKNNNS